MLEWLLYYFINEKNCADSTPLAGSFADPKFVCGPLKQCLKARKVKKISDPLTSTRVSGPGIFPPARFSPYPRF